MDAFMVFLSLVFLKFSIAQLYSFETTVLLIKILLVFNSINTIIQINDKLFYLGE